MHYTVVKQYTSGRYGLLFAVKASYGHLADRSEIEKWRKLDGIFYV
jgi:hypothetical protein